MKYFKILLLLLVSVIIFSAGCKKNKSVFTLQLKAKYGNQYFALDTFDTDTPGVVVKIQTLQFYLSHINLIKSDNSTVTLSNVALIDFSNPASLIISADGVEGNFKGINFGCGLDSLQNTPDSLNTTGPMNGTLYDMYWQMLGYRFEVMDGVWDTAAQAIMSYGLIYHIGVDSNFRQTQLNKNFSVCCGNPYTLTVYLDIRKIFHGNNETINIAAINTDDVTQTFDVPPLASRFADNFSQAFGF